MKTRKSLLGLKSKGGLLLLMALGSLMMSVNTYATSAGTILRNTVTVDYRDGDGNAMDQETDQVDVTVDLVASVVWGSEPTGVTVGSGAELPAAYTITLTNTGNGLDTYDITDGTTESCAELSAQSFTFTTPVTLGATVSSGAAQADTPAAGQTTIPVSNIDAAHFNVGTHVVIIGGNPYDVISASADGDGLTEDSLVVDDPTDIAAAAITGAGEQIGEQIDYSYGAGGNAGSLDPGTSTCDHEHELTADGTLAAGTLVNPQAQDSTDNVWLTTVEAVEITINKYVRNTTDITKIPVSPTVFTTATWNSETYYSNGVTANPDDVLEYLVVIENTGTGLATDIVFQDTLPAFTTLNNATVGVDNDNDGTLDEQVGVSGETVAAADGVIVTNGSDLRIFVGADTSETTASDTGATATTGGTGGGIAEGDISNIIYQLQIQGF